LLCLFFMVSGCTDTTQHNPRYVPYEGAINDVNLGANEINADYGSYFGSSANSAWNMGSFTYDVNYPELYATSVGGGLGPIVGMIKNMIIIRGQDADPTIYLANSNLTEYTTISYDSDNKAFALFGKLSAASAAGSRPHEYIISNSGGTGRTDVLRINPGPLLGDSDVGDEGRIAFYGRRDPGLFGTGMTFGAIGTEVTDKHEGTASGKLKFYATKNQDDNHLVGEWTPTLLDVNTNLDVNGITKATGGFDCGDAGGFSGMKFNDTNNTLDFYINGNKRGYIDGTSGNYWPVPA